MKKAYNNYSDAYAESKYHTDGSTPSRMFALRNLFSTHAYGASPKETVPLSEVEEKLLVQRKIS